MQMYMQGYMSEYAYGTYLTHFGTSGRLIESISINKTESNTTAVHMQSIPGSHVTYPDLDVTTCTVTEFHNQ